MLVVPAFGNKVVNCKTQEEFDSVLQIMEDNDFAWVSYAGMRSKPTEHREYWKRYESKTCINLSYFEDKEITYSASNQYATHTIITYQQFHAALLIGPNKTPQTITPPVCPGCDGKGKYTGFQIVEEVCKVCNGKR